MLDHLILSPRWKRSVHFGSNIGDGPAMDKSGTADNLDYKNG
jgi:hypothetical protein